MARHRLRNFATLILLLILVLFLWRHSKTPSALIPPLQQAALYFPLQTEDPLWKHRNRDTLARLIACRRSPGLPSCSPKDNKVVLLGTVHFVRVAQGMFDKASTFPAGEGIWADALLWALEQLKYPYLIIGSDNHNETNAVLGRVYALLGEDVSMVLGDFLSVPHCIKKSPSCLKTELNPNGIPSHKLFVFDGFGQDVGHPLGRQWHLTFYPNESKGFRYLGLTIEHYCHKFGVIPISERFNKIYVLGKDRAYLHPPTPQMFEQNLFVKLKNETGLSFTIATNPTSRDLSIWPGLEDIGVMSRDSFMYQLQHHRALIGIGQPVQPSTPLEALCVGTPFINPVWLGRRSQKDRSKWHSQHPYLAHLDPPYVYNVQDHRPDDVLKAIQEIMRRPLKEAFIPDDMKKEVYLSRVEDLINKDWKAIAADVANDK